MSLKIEANNAVVEDPATHEGESASQEQELADSAWLEGQACEVIKAVLCQSREGLEALRSSLVRYLAPAKKDLDPLADLWQDPRVRYGAALALAHVVSIAQEEAIGTEGMGYLVRQGDREEVKAILQALDGRNYGTLAELAQMANKQAPNISPVVSDLHGVGFVDKPPRKRATHEVYSLRPQGKTALDLLRAWRCLTAPQLVAP